MVKQIIGTTVILVKKLLQLISKLSQNNVFALLHFFLFRFGHTTKKDLQKKFVFCVIQKILYYYAVLFKSMDAANYLTV